MIVLNPLWFGPFDIRAGRFNEINSWLITSGYTLYTFDIMCYVYMYGVGGRMQVATKRFRQT